MVVSLTVVTVSWTVLSTVGVYTALHIPSHLFYTHYLYEYYTQQLPSSSELMIQLKQCCIQDSGCHLHVVTNVMNLKGIFTTPHIVGHGCLHIQLYTEQAPHIDRSENSLTVSTFLMTKKIVDVSYGRLYHTINCSVITKCFFIMKFSNSLKQFFLFVAFSLSESML
jgi:hypothetical protein